ncbi:MAG: hypothetical protein ACQKBU_08505, partial [Verrucomicrobiales bacterium]
DPIQPMTRIKQKLGLVSLICGILAFVLALQSGVGGLSYEKESLSLAERGVGFFKETVFGNEKAAESGGRELAISQATVFGLGITATICGILSLFIRKKAGKHSSSGLHISFDAGGAGLTFAALALLWNYVLIAILVGIVLAVMYAISNGSIELG